MGARGFSDRYGRWALVAGGSDGLGAAFSGELARRGMSILMVARRPELLEKSAAEIRARAGVEVRTLALDLSRPDFMPVLEQATAGLEIGILVCNAAVSYTGGFLQGDPTLYNRMIDLNCRANLLLIHRYAGLMAGRGRGGIIVMSSMAGLQGAPYVAAYGATKAFLICLAEGLSVELKGRGVDVTVCAPPAVRTPGYLASTPPGARSPVESEPEDVARAAVSALGRSSFVVPGAAARIARFLMTRLMSRRSAVAMMGRNTKTLFDRERNGPAG
jgi:short-subunit dehydrogenase